MTYVTGFLLAVPTANKAAYRKMTEAGWPVFADHGCLSVQENWGVDTPDGEQTSFPMAVKRKPDETVVFSWMTWPDKETCDRGWEAVMQDPRMAGMDMPFDGMRMMWGGFDAIFDSAKS